MFYITSLTNILSQLSPIHILNFTFLPYIVFVSCLRSHLLNEVLSFGYFLQTFLYVSLPYMLVASSYLTIFFPIILTLFGNLLITKLPIILFHPVLLELPLFTSRSPPYKIFLSKTLRLTCSLNMSCKPHTHNNRQERTIETPTIDAL